MSSRSPSSGSPGHDEPGSTGVLEALSSFKLHLPQPKVLTSAEELALLRSAFASNPNSLPVRRALAVQLFQANHFEELLALLQHAGTAEYQLFHLRAEALLTRETEAANLEVKQLCTAELESSLSPLERADTLTLLGKAHTRLGELEQARACLREALRLDAGDKDAYKRSIALSLRQQAPTEVLELAESLASQGILHSRLLCSRGLALAALGMMEEAREAQGLESFLYQAEPAPPPGWRSLADFTAALVTEVDQHPDVRFDRYGTASTRTWRIDEPVLTRSRLFPLLQQLIVREVEAYVARLPLAGHPFLAGRPSQAMLRNWCVITEGDGHETWHVHQNGWLSGVFYLHVQDHIALGAGKEGCLAFGLPEEIVGQPAALAFGEVLCRPRTGLMMLFPSHTYHRTYPHHGEGRRICFAFDILPAASAS